MLRPVRDKSKWAASEHRSNRWKDGEADTNIAATETNNAASVFLAPERPISEAPVGNLTLAGKPICIPPSAYPISTIRL